MRKFLLLITFVISGFGVFATAPVALTTPTIQDIPSRITPNSFLIMITDLNASELAIEIEYSGAGVKRSVVAGPGSIFNIELSGLTANTFYSVRVRALNCTSPTGCSDVSPWSAIKYIQTLVAVPESPILQADNNCATFVSISWKVTNRADEITNFQVWRKIGDSPNERIANVPGYQNGLFDLGIQPGIGTVYTVYAENSSGFKASNPVTINVKSFVPPVPPMNVKSSPENKSDTQLNITWENPNQDFGCGTDIRSAYYVMIKREGETEFKIYEIIYPSATNSLIKGLKPNERVEYNIFSVSNKGLSSQYTYGVDKTYGPASKPTNLIGVAFKDAVNHSAIDVSWDHLPNDEDYFVVEVSQDGVKFMTLGKIKEGKNIFKHEPIEEGVNYIYRVKAGNYLFGESDYVVTQPIKYPYSTAPNSPYGLTATKTATKVDLKWYDDSSQEENYVIERSVDNNTTFVELKKLNRNANNYTDSTVTTGKTYYYRVKAVNPIGSSGYSNVFEAKIGGTVGLLNNVEFNIFPNPTLDLIKVSLPSNIDSENFSISVLDQGNNEIFKRSYKNRNVEIDLKNFKSGVYNLILKTENETISKKVVKY